MVEAAPQLASNKTIIRLADRSDVPAILDYYTQNKLHLAPFEPKKGDDFYTQSYWCKEVEARWQAFKSDSSLKLFLFSQDNPKEIAGSINFANFIRGSFQSCTLGYSLAADRQSKGYMSEALKSAIAYVFTQLNLHRIMAAYLPHNQRSGKLLKRLGFVVEGYACDYLMINGQWQDHILASLTNRNWKLMI